MKVVVGQPAKTNKTGSEPSRRFSKRTDGNGSILVTSQSPTVSAGRPTF
jgi:hypothetical protein